MTKLIKPQFLYTKYDGSKLLKLNELNEFFNLESQFVETLEPFIDVAAKPFAIPVKAQVFEDLKNFNPWYVCGMLAIHKESGIGYYIADFRNDIDVNWGDIFYVFNIIENEDQTIPLEFFLDSKDFEWFEYNQNYSLEDLY